MNCDIILEFQFFLNLIINQLKQHKNYLHLGEKSDEFSLCSVSDCVSTLYCVCIVSILCLYCVASCTCLCGLVDNTFLTYLMEIYHLLFHLFVRIFVCTVWQAATAYVHHSLYSSSLYCVCTYCVASCICLCGLVDYTFLTYLMKIFHLSFHLFVGIFKFNFSWLGLIKKHKKY